MLLHSAGQVFGLGLDINGNAWNRTLVSMDPNTLAVTTVGVITGYGIESGGIAAIDVADRSLYWIGQQTNAGPNDPFYLIQVRRVTTSRILTIFIVAHTMRRCPHMCSYAVAHYLHSFIRSLACTTSPDWCRLVLTVAQRTLHRCLLPACLQVDLKDASIISTGRLCSDDAACPWSLEYLNKQF